MRLILASRSPRRAELLRAAGFEFEVVPADVDEDPHPGETALRHVSRLAGEKARTVGRRNPGAAVIAADTIVTVDDRLLGKPSDRSEAANMLKTLAGRTHEVLTGVAVRCAGRDLEETVSTRVRFLPISEVEIAWYVDSGEPYDKAGAYAIQGLGSRFIDQIEGSYSNVVGLPVATVARMLRELGYPVLRRRPDAAEVAPLQARTAGEPG